MKVREILKNGRIQWRVACVLEGKQHRRFFRTEEKANAYAADLDGQIKSKGAQWLLVDYLDRLDCMAALDRAKKGGFRLVDAVAAYEGTHKRPEEVPMATDALGRMMVTKRAQGLKPRSLSSLEHTIEQLLANHPKARVSEITTDDVELWLGNPKWSPSTRRTKRVDALTFFSFCVDREWITKNPVAKIPAPILDDTPPGILTIPQCKALMEATAKIDPGFLSYITLGLYVGIRAAELLRLQPDAVSLDRAIVTIAGAKAKTRQRRVSTLPENAVQWLRKGCDLPVSSWQDRFDAVRVEAKLKDCWPKNAMRHTFATYHYAFHRNADLTAAELGHSPDILFRHYRELATKEQGEEFFSIRP